MLNSGKKYSNSCVVRKKISERNNKPPPPPPPPLQVKWSFPNRTSQIHCLNSDGTGDLSLLRYKPDFVTSMFVINELYCIGLYLTTNHRNY